jgi:OmpA-OmpF porin, OOP family
LKLSALLLSLVAAPALAQMTPYPPRPTPPQVGPYIGGGIGFAQAKKGCLGILSGGGHACDDSDMAWGGYAGYRFLDFVAAEVAFHDLGNVTASGTGFNEHVHAMVMDLTGLGILQITENLGAFLRLGAYRATLDTSIRGVDDHTNGNVTYGAGLQWNLALLSGLGIRLDWQRYKNVGGDNTLYGTNTYDVLNASLFWRFK